MVFIPMWDAVDKIQFIFMQKIFLFDFWLFRDMLSLCQLNHLHLGPPASASQVLELQVYVAMLGFTKPLSKQLSFPFYR